MTINHSDRCWWRSFCHEVKRAFKQNNLEQKAYLYTLYECHMHKRLMREYCHYKRLDYEALRRKGAIDRRLGFYEWMDTNPD